MKNHNLERRKRLTDIATAAVELKEGMFKTQSVDNAEKLGYHFAGIVLQALEDEFNDGYWIGRAEAKERDNSHELS